MLRKLISKVTVMLGLLILSSYLGAEPVTISYWLWDSNQQPAYQKAADEFQAKNPNIKIAINQAGWDDYWSTIQTSIVGGTAPDVITDHLAKYLDFASKNQLVDLQPYVVRDKVNVSIYMNGLADLWVKNGKRYGLPKDWDTITIIYNKEMLAKAGITPEETGKLTWNPKDGGTFEKFIAKLSFDKNGRNGLDPKFDSHNVVQFGFALSHSDDRGQAQFSPFAVSNGWSYTSGTYKSDYKYNDPKFIETIDWIVKVTKKGYMADYASTKNGANSLFMAKKAAAIFDGSWMISTYSKGTDFQVGYAKLPTGPAGVKSMINGLGDSILIGCKHKEEAWKWVSFLGSEEAQKIIGSYGVVFPAIKSGATAALQAYKTKGIEVSAFTEESMTPGETFLYPVVDNGVKVSEILTAAFDKIFTYKSSPKDALEQANKKVLTLFKNK